MEALTLEKLDALEREAAHWAQFSARPTILALIAMARSSLADREDAARFAWFLSGEPKSHFILEYVRGVRERWTLEQWRAAIDAARTQPPKD